MIKSKDLNIAQVLIHTWHFNHRVKMDSSGNPESVYPERMIVILAISENPGRVVGITVKEGSLPPGFPPIGAHKGKDFLDAHGALLDSLGGWKEVDLSSTPWVIHPANRHSPWVLMPQRKDQYTLIFRFADGAGESGMEFDLDPLDVPNITRELLKVGFLDGLFYSIALPKDAPAAYVEEQDLRSKEGFTSH